MDISDIIKIALYVINLAILIFGVAIPFGEMKQWKKSFEQLVSEKFDGVSEKFDGVHGRIRRVEDDVKGIRSKI